MAGVLLVDDEADFVLGASELLKAHGHEVNAVQTLAAARDSLQQSVPDFLLLDLMLPDGNGLELLDEIQARKIDQVVLITGHPGIKDHIRHLGGPGVNYLTKPIDPGALLKVIRSGSEQASGQQQAEDHFGLIVGEHPSMRALYHQIEKVAKAEMPVLIVGETGTGKELVAEAIHRRSGRSGPFVAVNCGSLSRELAGSELFGHEKGSFTGAVRRHTGFFRRAGSGTLFLDEVTEMPIELQPHLLRVLETGRVLPVGSEQEVSTDARLVAATNRDPKGAIGEGILREDLYFRLSVFPIQVPPLRERRSDVPLIARYFLSKVCGDHGPRDFSEDSLSRMQEYHWPGNVRELMHVVQRAVIMADPGTELLELPSHFESPFSGEGEDRGVRPGRSIRDVERDLIEKTLEHFQGDKKAAADTLGISLNTLYNRLNSYKDAG